ncbi:imelysin family protein [Gilvimarinus polysaccharolyticus]|uniref:imelysin family protein n=1 Tax=Gilvimarinus polysaccharolyticus TaxID=863921 RepID=UPI00067367B4|nr:imelysin family protein [Gilvimarinus polysaccharolyticus]
MKIIWGVFALTLLTSCERNTAPPQPSTQLPTANSTTSTAGADQTAIQRKSVQLWDDTGRQLQQFTASCETLQTTVAQLLLTPDDSHLQAAQHQWRQTHGQLRQLAIPMALATHNPGLFTPLAQALSSIDQQPIAAGYLDSVTGYPHSGLINDISLDINHTHLRQQHGLTAANEASLGLHPLEFILFGETGQRRAADFVQATAGTATLLDPHNRRRDYLTVASTLLCDDSAALTRQWIDPQSPIAAPYFALTPAERLQLWQQMLSHELASLSSPQATQHCEFAANGCSVRWRQQGLNHFIIEAEDLLPILTKQQKTQWLSAAAALRTALSTEPSNDAAARQAVSALAQALNDRD